MRPCFDLYLDESYRLSRRFRAGRLRPGDPEWEKFCNVFGVTHLAGFAASGLPIISLTIAANTNNYNLFVAAGSPAYPVEVLCTINSGVIVGSVSTGSYAWDTGSGWVPGSVLRLVNNGRINGKGGQGGNGGSANPTPTNGSPGSAGGPALYAQVAIFIDNANGQINGGGGGGGGGGGASVSGFKGVMYYAGGGGGAGRGTTDTGGGSGGASSSGYPGASGGTGSDASAGGGGAGGGGVGGNGGSGGGFGSAGASGQNGGGDAPNTTGGSGGAAGNAVNGDSKITWIALGTVNGARVG